MTGAWKPAPGTTCDDRDVPTFAEAIRARRTAVGLSQSDLGALSGIHRATINAIEGAKSGGALTSMAVISRALGCIVDDAGTLIDVFDEVSVANVARAVLASPPKSCGPQYWRSLVDTCGSARPRLPEWWPPFRDMLAARMPAPAMQAFDAEVNAYCQPASDTPPKPAPSVTEPESAERRTCYVCSPGLFLLSQACMVIDQGLGTPYLVGSATRRRDYRDVDVRVIMGDDEFAQRFPGAQPQPMMDPLWSLLSSSVSVWLSQTSGLPVDFQVQSQSIADRYDGIRVPLGVYPHVFAAAGG